VKILALDAALDGFSAALDDGARLHVAPGGRQDALAAVAHAKHGAGHVEAIDELSQAPLPALGKFGHLRRSHPGLSIAARGQAPCGRPGAAG